MTGMGKNEEVDLSGFPASRKVYVEGSRPDIRVPMREISLSRTEGVAGEEENAPLRVYDTSGMYTDAAEETDIRRAAAAPFKLDRGAWRFGGVHRKSRPAGG